MYEQSEKTSQSQIVLYLFLFNFTSCIFVLTILGVVVSGK